MSTHQESTEPEKTCKGLEKLLKFERAQITKDLEWFMVVEGIQDQTQAKMKYIEMYAPIMKWYYCNYECEHTRCKIASKHYS